MKTTKEHREKLLTLALGAAKEIPDYKEGSVSALIDFLGRFSLMKDFAEDFNTLEARVSELEQLLDEAHGYMSQCEWCNSQKPCDEYCQGYYLLLPRIEAALTKPDKSTNLEP